MDNLLFSWRPRILAINILQTRHSFLALVGVAFLIANNWLKGFAYRTEMPWWIFAAAGLLAAAIALASVAMQALKAARRNPVKSLRAE